jgi:hypothetical protein
MRTLEIRLEGEAAGQVDFQGKNILGIVSAKASR